MEAKVKAPKGGKKECNVSVELWKVWLKLRRHGDPQAIAEKYNYSRPVVDNAINFGYVKSVGVAENITAYYMERTKKEAADALELVHLAEKIKK